MAQSLSCRRQKARGVWLGLFQGCIAKTLRSKCPSAAGKVKSMLHSQTAWRTDFCMKYLGLLGQNWRNAANTTTSLWKCAISNQRDCKYIL